MYKAPDTFDEDFVSKKVKVNWYYMCKKLGKYYRLLKIEIKKEYFK
jgi:hypothetical protein